MDGMHHDMFFTCFRSPSFCSNQVVLYRNDVSTSHDPRWAVRGPWYNGYRGRGMLTMFYLWATHSISVSADNLPLVISSQAPFPYIRYLLDQFNFQSIHTVNYYGWMWCSFSFLPIEHRGKVGETGLLRRTVLHPVLNNWSHFIHGSKAFGTLL